MIHSLPAVRRQRGFTIVELMVGVLIGIVSIVVMFQVFAVSEAQKRTTTGAGDAQQNGTFSLFQIERDARMAGYGINYMPLLGCTVNAWYEPSGTSFSLVLAPVTITNGAGGLPDRITFTYGNSDLFMAPAKLTQSMPSSAATFKVDNRFGFNGGDIVISAEAGKTCSLAQVSGVPGTPGQSDNVIHNSGNYTDASGANRPTQYNRPSGLPAPNNIAYAAWNPTTNTGGRLYNIGALPTSISYAVQANQLVTFNNLLPGSVDALGDGIVQLQAQYGYDQNSDGVIANAVDVAVINPGLANDQWADAHPVVMTSADWTRIIAVRLAVVARSITPERANPASGVCEATTVMPMWRAKNVALDIGADPNWRCYRYRVFEVTVPIRNMIWWPQPA